MIDPYEILDKSEKLEKLSTYADLKRELVRSGFKSSPSIEEVYSRALKNAKDWKDTEVDDNSVSKEKSKISVLINNTVIIDKPKP